jgi:hypothetical protein
LFDGYACAPYEGTQQFLVLWNGEICALAGLCHDEMAADLSYGLPAGLCKSLYGMFSGDIG